MKSKIAIIISLTTVILFSQCDSEKWSDCIRGKGEITKETRNFDKTIRGVETDISGDLYIKPGDANELSIEAQGNIIDNIETSVSNGILRISFDKCVKDYSSITMIATIPTTEYLSLVGSGDIYAYDTLFINELIMNIEGSGDIHMFVKPDTSLTNAPYVESNIMGSGKIELRGYADYHDILITGSGDVEAYEMETNTTKIKIEGSGNCQVYVNDLLDVNIIGSGNVYYKGNPELDVIISGSGKVIPR